MVPDNIGTTVQDVGLVGHSDTASTAGDDHAHPDAKEAHGPAGIVVPGDPVTPTDINAAGGHDSDENASGEGQTSQEPAIDSKAHPLCLSSATEESVDIRTRGAMRAEPSYTPSRLASGPEVPVSSLSPKDMSRQDALDIATSEADHDVSKGEQIPRPSSFGTAPSSAQASPSIPEKATPLEQMEAQVSQVTP